MQSTTGLNIDYTDTTSHYCTYLYQPAHWHETGVHATTNYLYCFIVNVSLRHHRYFQDSKT